MGVFIYKQRHYPPNHPDTVRRAGNYVRYIGARPGVAYAGEQGLFGQVTQEDGTIGDIREAMTTVMEEARRHTILYQSILSFEEPDAMELGLCDVADWQIFLRARVRVIAEGMGIPVPRFRWIAAVHLEPGHPHAHMVFWDGDQGVHRGFVQANRVREIRKRLIRDIYGAEFAELYERKEVAKASFRHGEMLLDALRPRVAASDTAQDRAAFGTFRPDRNLSLRDVDARLPELLQRLNEIAAHMPEHGRLSYGYMPEAVKGMLKEISRTLIEGSPQCRAAAQAYIQGAVRVAEFYSSQPAAHEQARNRAETEVLKLVSNRVLRFIRDKKAEGLRPTFQRGDGQALWADIYAGLLNLLQRKEDRKPDRAPVPHELSRQERREYARRQAFAGEDWEIE